MKKYLLLIVLSSLLFVSCQRSEIDELDNKRDINLVDVGRAKSVLSEVGAIGATKADGSRVFSEIATISAVNDDNGTPLYYVVNYNPTGFVILSADNRAEPIQAFSESGRFVVDTSFMNIGLRAWMEGAKNKIKNLRSSRAKQDANVAAQWEPEAMSFILQPPIIIGPSVPIPPEPGPCDCRDINIAPLTTTNWHQGSPYNAYAPLVSNGNGGYERAVAGCVAIAMGQIMAYHKYPTIYNYSTDSGKALLVHDAGVSVGTSYGFSASSAPETDIAPKLRTVFGYKSAKFDDYKAGYVASNIERGMPVVLVGWDRAGSLWFPNYVNGHAWVCDGVRQTSRCSKHSESGRGWITKHYLHMNWGWGSYGGNDYFI